MPTSFGVLLRWFHGFSSLSVLAKKNVIVAIVAAALWYNVMFRNEFAEHSNYAS